MLKPNGTFHERCDSRLSCFFTKATSKCLVPSIFHALLRDILDGRDDFVLPRLCCI